MRSRLLADRILTISLSIYSASDAVTERSYATTTRSYRTHPRRHTHDTTRDTVRTMASRHPSHEANEIGVAEPPAEKRVNILDDLLSDSKGASRDASSCYCRALPPPHTPFTHGGQPPYLARPNQLGLADDLPPGAEGADPSRRLVFTARPTTCPTVRVSRRLTAGITPTWRAVQFCRPVGGRARDGARGAFHMGGGGSPILAGTGVRHGKL